MFDRMNGLESLEEHLDQDSSADLEYLVPLP